MSSALGRNQKELTKISTLRLGGRQLSLQFPDSLSQLFALTGRSTLLGNLGLKGGVVLLNVDKVEHDVEDSREDERKEKGSSGQVYWVVNRVFSYGKELSQFR